MRRGKVESGRAGLVVAAAVALALAAPGAARAAGEIYTVAGNGRLAPTGEGGYATAAGLHPHGAVAALPGGGFLVVDGARVREVDREGRIRTVAGTGRAGLAGDGGPAVAARIDPSDVAALPGGGFLIADCANNRVRRVGADGRITTVAGSGPRGDRYATFAGDGGPATAARLHCPISVAASAGGGFVVADFENRRVRRVRLDGVIETVAGNGAAPSDPKPRDGIAATAAPLWPRSVSVAGDSGILVADWWDNRVRRVAPDGKIFTVAGNGREGRRADDGVATRANVSPYAVAATPGGGFLVADEGQARATGEEPRVRLVTPGGTIETVAGTGRFVPDPPRGDEQRGDGGPARRADLLPFRDVEALPDGGFLIAEGIESEDLSSLVPGLVRYVAPASPALFAAALRRDRARIFATRRRPHVSVSLTAPAQVEITLAARGRRVVAISASAPAGTTRIPVPRRLARTAHTVSLTATDARGRRALDRYEIYPVGWLTRSLAQLVAQGIVFSAGNFGSISGDGLLGCRRFRAGRVDCKLTDDVRTCRRVVAITLGHVTRRLAWGSYRCGYRAHPRWLRRLHPLRIGDFSCEVSDTSCPPDVFGRLRARELVPWG